MRLTQKESFELLKRDLILQWLIFTGKGNKSAGGCCGGKKTSSLYRVMRFFVFWGNSHISQILVQTFRQNAIAFFAKLNVYFADSSASFRGKTPSRFDGFYSKSDQNIEFHGSERNWIRNCIGIFPSVKTNKILRIGERGGEGNWGRCKEREISNAYGRDRFLLSHALSLSSKIMNYIKFAHREANSGFYALAIFTYFITNMSGIMTFGDQETERNHLQKSAGVAPARFRRSPHTVFRKRNSSASDESGEPKPTSPF